MGHRLAGYVVVLVGGAASVPAPAASAAPVPERVLTAPVILMSRPSFAARHLGTLPHRQRDGVATLMRVRARRTIRGIRWLRVHTATRNGWITTRHTRPRLRWPLPRAVRRRLDRLLDSAGGGTGAIVTDRAGAVLWQRRAGARRSLASNTKLFVTALYAHIAGGRSRGWLESILLPSDNALAEALSQRLGGPRAAIRYASRYGVRPSLHDGSGLDPADRASAAEVARFLVGEAWDRGFGVWKASLPTAGRTGRLAWRMVGGAAQGRCHAKTGTLPSFGVSALSGYCAARSRHQLVFSILMNGTASITQDEAVEDAIANLIAARG